jgi:hypothetical protein
MQAYLAHDSGGQVGLHRRRDRADGHPNTSRHARRRERNTMRYFSSRWRPILGALSAPPQARVEKSLRGLVSRQRALTPRRQLQHEMDEGDFTSP